MNSTGWPRREAPGRSATWIDPWALWRHKWYLTLSVAITVALGGAYLILTPPVYEAEARVMVERARSSFDDDRSLLRDREFLANQAEIIRSPLTVLRALKHATVMAPDTADEVSYVLAGLRVSPMLQTDVLKIGYRTRNPDEAEALIQAIISAYEEHARESRRDNYSENLELLARHEKDLRSELDGLQQRYHELREDSPTVGQGAEAFSVHMTLVKHLSERLAQARTRRVDLENQLRPLESGTSQAGVDSQALAQLLMLREQMGAGTEDIGEIQQEIWRAQLKLKELSQTFRPDYPQRKAMEEQVRWWEGLLAERVAAAADVLRRELDVVRSTEANLSRMYEKELAKVKQVDGYKLKEELVLGDIRRVVSAHESMLARFDELKLAEQELADGRAIVRVEVLDGPRLEPDPVWPHPIQLMGLCVVVGLALGVVAVVVVDRTDRPVPRPAPAPQAPFRGRLTGPAPRPRQLPMVRTKRR